MGTIICCIVLKGTRKIGNVKDRGTTLANECRYYFEHPETGESIAGNQASKVIREVRQRFGEGLYSFNEIDSPGGQRPQN